jgi:uncharacterized protein (TIGR00251 family)
VIIKAKPMKEPLDMENRYTDINVKIIPKSSRNEIVRRGDDTYKIKVTSPPVDGKANRALISLLSKKSGIPKKDIKIIRGEKSRNKTVRIHGLSMKDLNDLMD